MSEKYTKPIETEVCPNCETEIELFWDVEREGYKAFCPSCGKVLMLCDACRHAADNPEGKCDFKTDFNGKEICFRRLKVKEKPNTTIGIVVSKKDTSSGMWKSYRDVFCLSPDVEKIEIHADKVLYTVKEGT